MALASDPKQVVRAVGASRSLWAVVLALCPVSYLAVLLIRYSPVAGWLGAFFIAVSLLEVAAERARRFPGPQAWASGLGAAVAVGVAAFYVGRVSAGAAFLFSLALVAEIGFLWVCVPMVRRDLGGAEFDPGACVRGEGGTAEGCSRMSLAFMLFASLLVLGAGASWSRGEAWAPSPAAWVLALMALALGAMLLERLGFLARSARHGNLALPSHSHRSWITGTALVLLLAALLAALGPWKAPAPQDTNRAGTRSIQQPAPQTLPQLRQQLEQISTSLSAAAATAASMPRMLIALWLFLLFLLLLLIVIWLFSRSRVARRILALFTWLVARAVRVWRWLRALFRQALTPPAPARAEAAPVPAWAKDPFFDIFAHPELLSLLTRREIIVRTYHLFLTMTELLGRERRANQTPFEYARDLEFDTAEARTALRELTWSYVHAMYAGASVELPAPAAVQAVWTRVAESLLSHTSPEDLALRKETYLARTRGRGRRPETAV